MTDKKLEIVAGSPNKPLTIENIKVECSASKSEAPYPERVEPSGDSPLSLIRSKKHKIRKKILKNIYRKYLLKKAKEWEKTFLDEFWVKLVKVYNYPKHYILQRPSFFGHLVNDLIYERLAPGLSAKLKKLNPKLKNGKRAYKHHQFLTAHYGIYELKQHMTKLMTLMDVANSPEHFGKLVDKVFGKKGGQLVLDLKDGYYDD